MDGKGSDEVRLRRSIGATKDELYVDGRHVTKTEVTNLLESAGFSRSNPYNVVQQGKISAMATMREDERLELLKEIGGTKVYEERRTESLRMLGDSGQRRAQIEELLASIEERLRELDEEKEDLKKWQQLDRQRRGLEFALHDRELGEVRAKLEELEAQRTRLQGRAGEGAAGVAAALAECEAEVRALQSRRADVLRERDRARARRDEAVRRRTKAELDVRDLEERVQGEQGALQDAGSALHALEREVQRKREELARARADVDAQKTRESELARQSADASRRLHGLLNREGRSAQFSSPEERDAHLRGQISRIEGAKGAKESALATLEAQVAAQTADVARMAEEHAALAAAADERATAVAAQGRQLAELKSRREALHNARAELLREEEGAAEKAARAREEVERKERLLEQVVPRETRRAYEAVQRFASDHRLEGLHGMVIDLLKEPQAALFTALEVTAVRCGDGFEGSALLVL